MDIRVAGHQVDTGEALRSHVSDRLSAIADRYFSRAVAANVTFGRGPYEDFTCDIVAPVNQGVVLKSSNRANDAHVAFDGAADKIEKQLKRYMDRLRERRGEADGAAGRGECRLYHFRRACRRGGADPARTGDRRRNQGRHSRGQRVRRGDDARPSQHQCADVPQSRTAANIIWSIAGMTERSAGSNLRRSDKGTQLG